MIIKINGNSIDIETNLEERWECEREEDLHFAENKIIESIENHYKRFNALPYIYHGLHV